MRASSEVAYTIVGTCLERNALKPATTMLPFLCKRALQAIAAHDGCPHGCKALFLTRSRKFRRQELFYNGAARQLSTLFPADFRASACDHRCPRANEPLQAARLAATDEGASKTPSTSCSGGAHESYTASSSPDCGQQGTFECDRTFCPPEKGDHCPLSQLGLPQPRGNQSLMHQLDGGLQTLKRSFKCPRAYHALFVDAAGTLIQASQSTQQIYHEIGLKYGVSFSEEEIAAKYKAAYGKPWCRYRMRYEDDGRFYWQRIVQEATGCKDPALLEDLYQYYTTDKAWHIGDPEAEKALKAIRNAGIKLAVVSNFDTRLRPLMKVLHCYDWFDTIVVSAEVGLEKPNPQIFLTACKELDIKPEQVLHVGDDETNDLVGASAAGCDSLLWGVEVANFGEVAKKLGVKV